MKAMIFAAGLGTRLKPYTLDRPKALVEVNGMPLLEICIRRLLFFGFRDIVINVHHYADQVVRFLESKNNFQANIQISDESDLLLDTGGGLKRAATLLGNEAPVLLHNTDILSDLDLAALYRTQQSSEALATLAVRHRKTSRYLLFDEQQQLCGWKNEKTGDTINIRPVKNPEALAFSGIQVVDPKIFDFFLQGEVFSVVDLYLKAAETQSIKAFVHDKGHWLDAGKPEKIKEAASLLPSIDLSPYPSI